MGLVDIIRGGLDRLRPRQSRADSGRFYAVGDIMTGFRYRSCRQEDIDQAIGFWSQMHLGVPSHDSIRSLYAASKRGHFLFAKEGTTSEDGTAVIGTIVAEPTDELTAHLRHFVVDPRFIGKGVRSALLEKVEERLGREDYRIFIYKGPGNVDEGYLRGNGFNPCNDREMIKFT